MINRKLLWDKERNQDKQFLLAKGKRWKIRKKKTVVSRHEISLFLSAKKSRRSIVKMVREWPENMLSEHKIKGTL